MGNEDERDDIDERLDRLEATLEELRDAIVRDERIDAGRRAARPAAERALRLTERLAISGAVAALEANVRMLEFLQERLEGTQTREARGTTTDVSDRLLERLDDALVRMEDAIAAADLPRNADARRLLERARDLNDEVRGRVGASDPAPSGPSVVEIDVEEELDQLREDVEEDSAADADEDEE